MLVSQFHCVIFQCSLKCPSKHVNYFDVINYHLCHLCWKLNFLLMFVFMFTLPLIVKCLDMNAKLLIIDHLYTSIITMR